MKKKSLGRQKIEMKKMTNETHLQITFTKRRTSLFKKASELNTLCGVELALLVFSPAKNVFCFGHPSVDTVADRYLGCDTTDTAENLSLVEDHRNANIRELCMKVNQARSLLEAEKDRGQELDENKESNQRNYWWTSPIDELDLLQLLQLKSSMEELKKQVDAEKLVVLNANLRLFFSAEGLNPDNVTNDNSLSFISNMLGGECGVADKIVPTSASACNPCPAEGNPQGIEVLGSHETDALLGLTLGLGGGVL